ncbi:MAG TPA: molybdopterin-dependent oxidoreductase [Candidatus Eremiobacteraceae bacterium]|nr:molybdopterin-dependent oxidoreductase [Candidatus Eremiobacteraceae bacterium]
MHEQFSRHAFVMGAAALAGGLSISRWSSAASAAETMTMPFANGARTIAAYPQKRDLIVLTSRPVQLETPFALFDQGPFTPNDAFFVRWHLSGVPTTIDPAAFRLSVRGFIANPVTLSLDDLKKQFSPAEITAVCQCSGNSRGFFEPRVPGGQWGNGAMGNATWRGARLKDILARAGVKSGAVQVRFNGMDKPVLAQTPDFMKSLDLTVATSDDIIVAYEMNGEPLPLLNGFPARLVVPGWYATYWVKMLDDIEVLAQSDDNFWMKTAYRVPADPCGCQQPGTKVATVPISLLNVRSFITNVTDGSTVSASDSSVVRGIAFDRGSGIAKVRFSSDGGATWSQAKLGPDRGKYGFREWSARFNAERGKQYILQSVATANDGATQAATPSWNASGYARNVIESVKVTVPS